MLPPGPDEGVLLQTVRMHRDPLGTLREAQRRFGDVFTVRMATARPIVVVASPAEAVPLLRSDPGSAHAGEARRRILPMASPRSVFGGDGEQHHEARSRIAAAFAPDAVGGRREAMAAIAARHADGWPQRAPRSSCRGGARRLQNRGSRVAPLAMNALPPESLEFSESYVEGDDSARWRSASGHEGSASGSSVLEVAPGCRLPRHTDSAEETIVVAAGVAEVEVGGDRAELPAGGLALVPADVPHEVRNAADEPLRFVAVYASSNVVTRYEQEIQPDGARERQTVG